MSGVAPVNPEAGPATDAGPVRKRKRFRRKTGNATPMDAHAASVCIAMSRANIIWADEIGQMTQRSRSAVVEDALLFYRQHFESATAEVEREAAEKSKKVVVDAEAEARKRVGRAMADRAGLEPIDEPVEW